MAVNIPLLRKWLAATAMVVVVVVAGVYFYMRMRISLPPIEPNKKLGVEIQQSTEGFSLSKSENGQTLFTVRAARAVQYKKGGRAELHDVSIIVYGRQGGRFDQIYGDDFQYDPESGNVISQGVVRIDLQAGEVAALPGRLPTELKNPIHLQTSGLVFNQKSGEAYTHERIEFSTTQGSGSAQGASYDSGANTLTLESDIRVQTRGAGASSISAARGVISKNPRRVVLERASITRSAGSFAASQLTFFLRDDNTVERMLASGEVNLESVNGHERMNLRAPRGEAWAEGKDNLIRRAMFSGGVAAQDSGTHPMQAYSERVLMDFDRNGKMTKARAVDNVKLTQEPSGARASSQSVELNADAMDFTIRKGTYIERADTSGKAQIVISGPTGQSGSSPGKTQRTVITAGQFKALFDRNNRLKSLRGAPDARIVSFSPGQPDKVSTSRELEASFDAKGAISAVVQQGKFEYHEPLAGNRGERAAWAQKASYTPDDQTLVLLGSPRVVEGGMTTTARTMRISRSTGELNAEGEVKTTYSETKPQPGGALLATAEPIHVTARKMVAGRSEGAARYSGEARLWQGANIVQAPSIEFNRDLRSLGAQGTQALPVKTVLVQQSTSGKQTLVSIAANRLTYTDQQRLARFEGGVVVRSADGSLSAGQAEAYMKPAGSGATASGPAQLTQIIAEKQVVLAQPNRRATGEKLVYTVAEEKFVLTGGPPSIWDAERGTITGASLTFYSRDDRVVVEGEPASRAVTQTRVSK